MMKNKIFHKLCLMNLVLIFKGGMNMKKKVKLELTKHEVEDILFALIDEMENFDEDSNVYMNLLKLELKIRKEYEICTRLG